MHLIQTCLTISSRKLKLIRFSYSKGLLYQLVLRERGDDTDRRVVLGSEDIRLMLQKVGLQEDRFERFRRWLFYFRRWWDVVLQRKNKVKAVTI